MTNLLHMDPGSRTANLSGTQSCRDVLFHPDTIRNTWEREGDETFASSHVPDADVVVRT
jgi:hypothetical protein